MHTEDMRTRARSFEQGAEAYERLRPGYPDALFDALRAEAGDRLRGEILEVGAGTGRATIPLARGGGHVTVVEPSAEMRAILASRLSAEGLADAVTIRAATFEDVPPDERYPVVVAAQSFHWADPDSRWDRLAALLGDDGRAFLFWNGHRLDAEVHDLPPVRRLFAERGPQFRSDAEPDHSDNPWAQREIADHPGLRLLAERSFEWSRQLATADYLELLRTTSQWAVAPTDEREPLLAALGELLGDTVTLRGATLFLVVGPR